MQNFRKKYECYGCGTTRDADCELVPATFRREDDPSPCTVLVVRGLDSGTVDTAVFNAMCQYGPQPLGVRHIAPRGICFVEYSNTELASRVLDTISAGPRPLYIGNRRGMSLRLKESRSERKREINLGNKLKRGRYWSKGKQRKIKVWFCI